MSGSLASFQSDLGRALRGEGACPIDENSAGFRFTLKVRRSWCEGRVMIGSRAVLSAIPETERRQLVNEYVNQGGGLEMFLDREAEAFLTFLEPHLPNPSHALTLCQMHQAVARAKLGASSVAEAAAEAEGNAAARSIRHGRYASLVWFHADPGAVVAGLKGAKLPPLGPPQYAVFFAPRLPELFRIATRAEVELWTRLPIEDASPALIAPLLLEGVVEYADT